MIKMTFEAVDYTDLCKQLATVLSNSGMVVLGKAQYDFEIAKAATKRTGKTGKSQNGSAIAKPEPEPQPEPQPDPQQAVNEEEEDNVTPAQQEAVNLYKLKEETLDRLRELFPKGKGALVRQLLADHGHGAKVFPEVEAIHFPAIKEALDKALAS